MLAQRKSLKPSIGLVRRLMARWSCFLWRPAPLDCLFEEPACRGFVAMRPQQEINGFACLVARQHLAVSAKNSKIVLLRQNRNLYRSGREHHISQPRCADNDRLVDAVRRPLTDSLRIIDAVTDKIAGISTIRATGQGQLNPLPVNCIQSNSMKGYPLPPHTHKIIDSCRSKARSRL